MQPHTIFHLTPTSPYGFVALICMNPSTSKHPSQKCLGMAGLPGVRTGLKEGGPVPETILALGKLHLREWQFVVYCYCGTQLSVPNWRPNDISFDLVWSFFTPQFECNGQYKKNLIYFAGCIIIYTRLLLKCSNKGQACMLILKIRILVAFHLCINRVWDACARHIISRLCE